MSVRVILKSPGARISICASPTRKAGKVYPGWEVRESTKGSPVLRRKFSDQKEADEYARGRARLVTGQTAELPLCDLNAFRISLTNIKDCGLPLESVTADYAAAHREIEAFGVTMAELARFYVAHHRAINCKKTVREVVAELIERREREGVSAKHLNDLDLRLKRFAKDVDCELKLLSAPLIQQWLDGLKNLSGRTVRNFRNALSNLIGFAKLMKYLPADFYELNRIEKIKVRSKPIQIFTPTEMFHLVRSAPDAALPVLAIGGFAGLRTSEILLLPWENVDWQQNSIVVPHEGKTKERRVPMEPSLRAWLEPLRKTGRIVPLTENGLVSALVRTVDAANKELAKEHSKLTVKWKHNALRHSYVSYKSRLEPNPYLVSTWTGHSVATMKRFYCNATVTNESARAWFAIQPEGGTAQLSLFQSAVPEIRNRETPRKESQCR